MQHLICNGFTDPMSIVSSMPKNKWRPMPRVKIGFVEVESMRSDPGGLLFQQTACRLEDGLTENAFGKLQRFGDY